MKIKKIAIKGSSGYGPGDLAYEDKLVLAEGTISYEYKPFMESDANPYRKWTYRSNGPVFLHLFQMATDHMLTIIENPPMGFATDIGGIEFTVTFEDKSKWKQLFWLPGDEFEEMFSVISKLVPESEYKPAVLLTSSDFEEE